MSLKSNGALQVDKDAIASFSGYSSSLASFVEQLRGNATACMQYLLAEENIAGGATEAFRDCVSEINSILTDVQAKTEVMAAGARKTAEAVNVIVDTKTKTLAQHRDGIAKLQVTIKMQGKK